MGPVAPQLQVLFCLVAITLCGIPGSLSACEAGDCLLLPSFQDSAEHARVGVILVAEMAESLHEPFYNLSSSFVCLHSTPPPTAP